MGIFFGEKRQKPDPHFSRWGPDYDIDIGFGGIDSKYATASIPEGIELLKGDMVDLAKKYWRSTKKKENQVGKLPPLPPSWATGILRLLTNPGKGTLYEAVKKSPLKVSDFTTLVGGKSRRDLLLNLIGKKKTWTKDQLDYLRRLDDAKLNLGTKLDDFFAKFMKSLDDGTPMPKIPKFKGIEDSAKNILKKAKDEKTTFHAEGGLAGMLGEPRSGYQGGGGTGYEAYWKMVQDKFYSPEVGGEEGTGMKIHEFADIYFPRKAEGGRIGYRSGSKKSRINKKLPIKFPVSPLEQRINELWEKLNLDKGVKDLGKKKHAQGGRIGLAEGDTPSQAWMRDYFYSSGYDDIGVITLDDYINGGQGWRDYMEHGPGKAEGGRIGFQRAGSVPYLSRGWSQPGVYKAPRGFTGMEEILAGGILGTGASKLFFKDKPVTKKTKKSKTPETTPPEDKGPDIVPEIVGEIATQKLLEDKVTIDDKTYKRSDKNRPPTEEELEYDYGELGNDEQSPLDFGSTIAELDAALADRKAEWEYYRGQYMRGELDKYVKPEVLEEQREFRQKKISKVIEKAFEEIAGGSGFTGTDYKYDAQILADSIAEELGKGAYDELPQTYQTEIYNAAQSAISEQAKIKRDVKNLSKPTKTLENLKKTGIINISDPDVASEFSRFMKESDPEGFKDIEEKIEIESFDPKGRKKNAFGGRIGLGTGGPPISGIELLRLSGVNAPKGSTGVQGPTTSLGIGFDTMDPGPRIEETEEGKNITYTSQDLENIKNAITGSRDPDANPWIGIEHARPSENYTVGDDFQGTRFGASYAPETDEWNAGINWNMKFANGGLTKTVPPKKGPMPQGLPSALYNGIMRPRSY